MECKLNEQFMGFWLFFLTVIFWFADKFWMMQYHQIQAFKDDESGQ